MDAASTLRPSARSRTITGLTNGTTYYFRVAAYNADGRSPSTTSVKAVPRTVPSVPRSLTATPGYNQVTLRWAAPASTGGSPIQGYTISYAPTGGTWTSLNVSASTRSRTITGLRGGTNYYFRIAAYNAAGRSPSTTSVKAVPKAYTKPGATSIYSVTAGNHAVTLYWSQPANTGGQPITNYQVQIGSRRRVAQPRLAVGRRHAPTRRPASSTGAPTTSVSGQRTRSAGVRRGASRSAQRHGPCPVPSPGFAPPLARARSP